MVNPSPTDRKPRVAPFSHGLSWLLQSLSLVRMQAGRMLLIAVFMQLVLGLTRLQLVGFLVVISVPGLTAGILEAFHTTAKGSAPGLNLLFKPLFSSAHTARLLAMGALIFLVGVLSISLLLSGTQDVLDPNVISRIEQGDVDAISLLDQQALGRIILAFLVGISVSGTLGYFTIPLIWFGDRKLGSAIADGLRALFINWRSFVMLALGLVAIMLPVAIVTGILLGMARSGGLVSVLVMVVILILLLAFQMLLFGTQYCAYRDIFGIEDELPPRQEEDDSQLLA
jgi:hypothetical protein